MATLLAAGVTVGWLIRWNPTPAILGPTFEQSKTMAVTQAQFDDARTVPVIVTLGVNQSLTSPVAGRVTSQSCQVGESTLSGTSMMAVDGVPLVSLATSIPMWRDLERGTRGTDVEALETELARLGVFTGNVTSTVDDGVIQAWRSLAASLGVPASELPRGKVPQSMIVWLPPSADLTFASCDAQVGMQVSLDQALATLAAPLTEAHIGGHLSQLVSGDRDLVIDDQTKVQVRTDGTIGDDSSLAALAASPTVNRLKALGVLDTLTGTFALSTPIAVSVVSPAAIVSAGGTTGCLLADGVARSVTIVSSQLGQSFVVFDDGRPPPLSVALDPPRSLTCH